MILKRRPLEERHPESAEEIRALRAALAEAIDALSRYGWQTAPLVAKLTKLEEHNRHGWLRESEAVQRLTRALRAMREWHRTYHGEDRCALCIEADAVLEPKP